MAHRVATVLLRSAVILLLLICLAPSLHASPPFTVPDGTLHVSQRGAATVLNITQHGRRARLVLPGQEGIYPRSLNTAKLVGAIPGRVLILSIDYASRPNGGAHMCGAGTETMLRVIALRPVPRQTFYQLIESCWESIEAGEVRWFGDTGVLTVERYTYKDEVQHLRTHYRIDRDGTVTPGEVERLP